jgi:hypothetical protein
VVAGAKPYLGDQNRSPIVTASIASIVFAFLAVGILASYLPRTPPLGWSVGCLAISAVLFVVAVGLIARLHTFAWPLFFRVARWVSVLPAVFAATAIFVFVADGTKGAPLAIMITVLLLASANIPLVVAFSVARHDPASTSVGNVS